MNTIAAKKNNGKYILKGFISYLSFLKATNLIQIGCIYVKYAGPPFILHFRDTSTPDIQVFINVLMTFKY